MLKLSMFYRIIATLFFIGYIPIAQGTIASVFTMGILWLFKPVSIVILSMWVISFSLGIFTSGRLEKELKDKDPSCVVIDEFAGSLTAVLFMPLTFKNILLAFILFRLFDIIKPPPIRQIERNIQGGFGIMLDDIIAGGMANLLMRLFLML